MEPLKVTFHRELTFGDKTFEKEAVYGSPQIGQHFVDEGKVMECFFDFKYVVYPILTQKKKVYTVIKVEGDHVRESEDRHAFTDALSSAYTQHFYMSKGLAGTAQVVEE